MTESCRIISRFIQPTSFAAVGAGALAITLLGCATPSSTGTELLDSSVGYKLTTAEQSWHCESLQNAIQVRITKISTLVQQAKAESDATAPTLSKLLARTFGQPGSDLTTLQQIKPERAAADAYNAVLKSKGCATVDIDAKLPVVRLPGTIATNR